MFQSFWQVAPETAQELSDALVQMWEEIPKDTIHHQAQGGHTNYWAPFGFAVMTFQ